MRDGLSGLGMILVDVELIVEIRNTFDEIFKKIHRSNFKKNLGKKYYIGEIISENEKKDLLSGLNETSKNIYRRQKDHSIEELTKPGYDYNADIKNNNENVEELISKARTKPETVTDAEIIELCDYVVEAHQRIIELGNKLKEKINEKESSLAKSRHYGVKARQVLADQFAKKIGHEIEAELKLGSNPAQIARKFNKKNIKTSQGGKWQGTTIRRVHERYKKLI